MYICTGSHKGSAADLPYYPALGSGQKWILKEKCKNRRSIYWFFPKKPPPNFHSFAFKTAQDFSSNGLSLLKPIYTFSICKILLQGVLKFKYAWVCLFSICHMPVLVDGL